MNYRLNNFFSLLCFFSLSAPCAQGGLLSLGQVGRSTLDSLYVDSTESTMVDKKLQEVIVDASRTSSHKYDRFLRDVEESMIHTGKKSNVAVIENLLMNKAANTTRQLFSSISGIVIHEGSDGGLQLNIGARGLNPNRSANFNMRQNGYDISADPLGYPESYYTPNADDIREIQVLRGASALQYGSQFGGMVNFKLAEAPQNKKFDLRQHLSLGSYGFISSYTRLSGTIDRRFSYYLSSTLKRGDGYRYNADFKSYSLLGRFHYRPNTLRTWGVEALKYHYLEHQPGGLTDVMFHDNPKQSNRSRNWFEIDWNILSLSFHQFFNDYQSELQFKGVGLYAHRYALGFRDKRVSTPDPENVPRDLQKGTFRNWGAELRYIHRFKFHHSNQFPSVWAIGIKYYQGANLGKQGLGTPSQKPDFCFFKPWDQIDNAFKQPYVSSSYRYPNLNFALFSELAISAGSRLRLVPGFRVEHICTAIKGTLKNHEYVIEDGERVAKEIDVRDDKYKRRNIILFGIAAAYKLDKAELYGNITQNYRAITFNDLRTVTPAYGVNPNLRDERGFSSDFGIRSRGNGMLNYDVSLYFLYYGQRIGEYFRENPQEMGAYQRYKDNIGNGISYGIEGVGSWCLDKWICRILGRGCRLSLFANAAITGSRYLKSQEGIDVRGHRVEFVPLYNLKGGLNMGYKQFSLGIQVGYTSFQYTDANNQPMDLDDNTYGIYGAIPGYCVLDATMDYQFSKRFAFCLSLQNIGNSIYMTRRATGYPGPGIIPSAPFNFMATAKFHY